MRAHILVLALGLYGCSGSASDAGGDAGVAYSCSTGAAVQAVADEPCTKDALLPPPGAAACELAGHVIPPATGLTCSDGCQLCTCEYVDGESELTVYAIDRCPAEEERAERAYKRACRYQSGFIQHGEEHGCGMCSACRCTDGVLSRRNTCQ